MRWERLIRRSAGIALLGVLLVACSGDSGGEPGADADGPTSTETTRDPFADCVAPVDRIGEATERYIAGFEAAVLAAAPADTGGGPDLSTASPADGESESAVDEAGYREALEGAQEELASNGCNPLRTRVELRRRLVALEAASPVADAVLRQLTATLTDPASATPVDVTVAVGDDLRQVVSTAADGSTVRLEPGEHRLDGPLVVLSGIRVVGAGEDASRIVADAADAVVVTLTDRTVRFEQLSLQHDGESPASVLLAGPASSTALDDVTLSGARADADGLGGAGILLFATTDGGAVERQTTLELTDVTLEGNESAGVVLSGAHRMSAVRLRIVGSGQCGLCFFDTADGSVEDSVLEDNAVGVAVAASARPTLLRLEIDGGDVGLQASGTAAPVLRRVSFARQTQASAIFSDSAAGSVEGVACVDVEFGLVVGRDARPLIGDVDCDVVRAPG